MQGEPREFKNETAKQHPLNCPKTIFCFLHGSPFNPIDRTIDNRKVKDLQNRPCLGQTRRSNPALPRPGQPHHRWRWARLDPTFPILEFFDGASRQEFKADSRRRSIQFIPTIGPSNSCPSESPEGKQSQRIEPILWYREYVRS
jgi:hypothetical protein